ncbi:MULTISPECIES: enoyl-CoA hydratase-related protein [unclassified Mycolicibacterium]|uniref:enoyl-CoA hydratase-related protein n=1 Tax=unclassified Mycolicibacterium TaxID=2636767 RepID=UPI001F4C09A6|nr:enoyl-CoA hydratase-related protein [Mycolicibacterium sp. YH-1]UNB50266.1 enoyl-CoA hydratase-related protein [Mycolicibacterium sp. YH-1]
MTDTPSTQQPVLTAREGAILNVTFNRPERLNAATPEMEAAIVRACDVANSDETIRIVTFSGATGSRASFMAGADLSTFSGVDSAESVQEIEEHAEHTLAAIEGLRVPAVAILDGPVIGQGALIASCCDVLLAGPDVLFGFPIARTVGNCLGIRNLSRMTDLVGIPATKTMIMRAKLFNSAELAQTGALSAIADSHAALREMARTVAEEMAGLAPLTLSYTKLSLARMREPGATNDDLVVQSYLSRDAGEAAAAFLEKRPAQWLGR